MSAGADMRTRGAHQWRGLIEEYRERLPVDDDTPVITLREGGTPLVRSDALSGKSESCRLDASFSRRIER